MLSKATRDRIKSQNWKSHTNLPQFFSRLIHQSKMAIKDLTLIATKLDEEQLKEIFTEENLKPLIAAILYPPSTNRDHKPTREERDRVYFLGFLFVNAALEITGRSLGNKVAEEYYNNVKAEFKKVMRLIYQEKLNYKS